MMQYGLHTFTSWEEAVNLYSCQKNYRKLITAKPFGLIVQAECFVIFFVSAPECRDIETVLYDHTSVRTYIFSVLCSIFQYVIKRWLRALQLSGSREHKSDYGCL